MSSDVKTTEEILGMWADLRVELEAVDQDMHKNLVKGNTAAGRRARTQFRALKKSITAIVREMVTLNKDRAANKKSKKDGK